MHDVIGQVRARKSLKCDVTVFLICFNLCAERVMDNIEIIYDELKRNQIHIDKHALIISHKQNSQSKQRLYILKYMLWTLNNFTTK